MSIPSSRIFSKFELKNYGIDQFWQETLDDLERYSFLKYLPEDAGQNGGIRKIRHPACVFLCNRSPPSPI